MTQTEHPKTWKELEIQEGEANPAAQKCRIPPLFPSIPYPLPKAQNATPRRQLTRPPPVSQHRYAENSS